METEVIMKRSSIAPARVMPQGPPLSRRKAQKNRREAEHPFRGGFGFSRGNYFFWTYFRQSSMTATRMMMPEITNWRLASMPRVVRA